MTEEIREVLELARNALVYSIYAVSPKPEHQVLHNNAINAIDKLLKQNERTT